MTRKERKEWRFTVMKERGKVIKEGGWKLRQQKGDSKERKEGRKKDNLQERNERKKERKKRKKERNKERKREREREDVKN